MNSEMYAPGMDPRALPLSEILKTPADWANRIREDEVPLSMSLKVLAAGLACYAVYGFSAGLFSGWAVGLMAALKSSLIAGASLALCLPSLYVFCAVGGEALTRRQALAVGSSMLALTGLLLLALAPIGWLFAVSTNSLAFVTILDIAIWGISTLIGMRVVGNALWSRSGGAVLSTGLWLVLYITVTLQMTTVLRPILTSPTDGAIIAQEKMFFLSNFKDTVGNELD